MFLDCLLYPCFMSCVLTWSLLLVSWVFLFGSQLHFYTCLQVKQPQLQSFPHYFPSVYLPHGLSESWSDPCCYHHAVIFQICFMVPQCSGLFSMSGSLVFCVPSLSFWFSRSEAVFGCFHLSTASRQLLSTFGSLKPLMSDIVTVAGLSSMNHASLLRVNSWNFFS